MEHIYIIENLVNHKKYVGRTERLEYRKRLHMSALKSNRHPNSLLQYEFNKYRQEAFVFYVIESANNFVRTNIERKWILELKTYNPQYGYNYKDPVAVSRHGCFTKHIPIDERDELTNQLKAVEELLK